MEGLLTIVVAIVAKFTIVDWPESAKFLTPEERALLFKRLEQDGNFAQMGRLDKSAALLIAKDWKIWVAYDLSASQLGYLRFDAPIGR